MTQLVDRAVPVDVAGPVLLSPADLHRRICVREPYFALREVAHTGPGEVRARVPVELDPGAEAAPISVAEAGRHLAILGSCAAAAAAPRDGQHFYLACAARGRWLSAQPRGYDGLDLRGHARARFTGARGATATTVLAAADGTELFALDVEYHVLSAAVFARVFAAARCEPAANTRGALRAVEPNPYCTPLRLVGLRRDEDRLVGSLTVRPESCPGHFPQYPALPVAVVAGVMTRLAGTLLGELAGTGQPRWLTRSVRLSADSLAVAGETVTFVARRLHRAGAEHTFACTATVAGRAVASLDLVLSQVDPG